MNVVSLFDGISCLRVALERSKIKVDNYWASEIDDNAIKISQSNWNDVTHVGDITKLNFKGGVKVDLLAGGSSCQNFSFSGNKLGMISESNEKIVTLDRYLELKNSGFSFKGESYLFWEYVRLLNEIKPKYFLLENVKMSKEWETVISTALQTSPIMIDSQLVSAQKRKRLYWTNIPNITQPLNKKIFLNDVLDVNYDFECWIQKGYKKDNLKSNCITTKHSHSDAEWVINTNFPIEFTERGALKKQEHHRLLKPLEMERLQTLPDGYTKGVSIAAQVKALGNGWTIDSVSHILNHI